MKTRILACFFNNLPRAWAWRFLAGLASRALVVLATPLSLSLVKRKAIERDRLDKN
ncbi:hypothetical protein [Helicobacter labacensis]|uniref:hypothetical protein n=1 Tax=Helicobacter labacensis TaxID=2316079 RepID=UPI001968B30C|nr:hypothetical protein [Helicobacter labacensis]